MDFRDGWGLWETRKLTSPPYQTTNIVVVAFLDPYSDLSNTEEPKWMLWFDHAETANHSQIFFRIPRLFQILSNGRSIMLNDVREDFTLIFAGSSHSGNPVFGICRKICLSSQKSSSPNDLWTWFSLCLCLFDLVLACDDFFWEWWTKIRHRRVY